MRKINAVNLEIVTSGMLQKEQRKLLFVWEGNHTKLLARVVGIICILTARTLGWNLCKSQTAVIQCDAQSSAQQSVLLNDKINSFKR